MKTLEEVIEHAQSSPTFANKLKKAAEDAVSHGVGTDEWAELMKHFAQSPAELDELREPHSIADPRKRRRAFRTVLTYTSAVCPFTIFVSRSGDEDAGGTAKGARRRYAAAKAKRKPVAKAKRARKPATKAKRSR